MATLAIRKGTWTAFSTRNFDIVRLMDDLQLGEPVEYLEPPGAAPWFLFDDSRWTAEHVAYLACVLSNLGQIAPAYVVPTLPGVRPDRAQLKQDMRDLCDGLPGQAFVPPGFVPHVEGKNRWQELIDAQGTGANMGMTSGVPDGWTAVEVTP